MTESTHQESTKLSSSVVPSRLTKVVRGALDRNGSVLHFSQVDLNMYLSACKFLDTSLAFPPERMPLFQM